MEAAIVFFFPIVMYVKGDCQSILSILLSILLTISNLFHRCLIVSDGQGGANST